MTFDQTKAYEELEKRYNRLVGTSATNLCTHCGWCIDSCHVYLATQDPALSPVAKADRVRQVYKGKHDWLSKILPWWTGATKELTEAELDDWAEIAFKACTLCERCVINCPMGVETPQFMAVARGLATAMGKEPEILTQLADAAIVREEHQDMFKEFYLEQISELETEVQERLGDPNARIPVNEPADILYVPLAGAHTMVPQAVMFNMVGESWTMSMFEASNYALFAADIPKAKRITKRILDEAARLGAKKIVVSECGHAYGVLRWEAPKWFGGPLDFEVLSILEVLDEYVAEGKIQLDPALNTEAVTYHDPCNIGRKGGIFDQPRRIIQASAGDYREMTPTREQNYCCGGGAGLVAMLDASEERLTYGKPKADQIRETGAQVVVTSCDNCRHQIGDLSERYDLGVTVTSASELLLNALVLDNRVETAPSP